MVSDIVAGIFPMILTTQTHALEISPEKANYIMNICSGRILVDSMEWILYAS